MEITEKLRSYRPTSGYSKVMRKAADEIDMLRKVAEADQAAINELQGMLKDIGDFAHDRSTGPAVEDDLWEVRRMAYELLTPNAEVTGCRQKRQGT